MLRNILIIGLFSFSITLTGCQKEAEVSSGTSAEVKKARLLVDENLQLKAQINALEAQITETQAVSPIAVAEKEAELQTCIEERNTLEEQLSGMFEQQFLGILTDVLNENKLLQEENEKLKEQIKSQDQEGDSVEQE